MSADTLIRQTRQAGSRVLPVGLLLACLSIGTVFPMVANAQLTVTTPDVVGDQLIFFYDARSGRTPFLSFSNPASSGINVDVAFYDAGLDSRISELSCSLDAASNLLIDPTASTPPATCTVVAGAGAASGNAGLAVITPVAGSGSTQAVVPPAPLTGNFTLANLTLGSAFGENAFGRLAVNGDGSKAAAGQNVDGSTVRYQRFTPAVLMVPVYFNPNTLGAPENDGNRVILAEFNDQYGARFDVTPLSDSPMAVFFTNGGQQLTSQAVSVTGVLLSNLQEVSGGVTFNSSGKAFFTVSPGGGNAFGIFSQSQGTFASGQRMPAVDAVPSGNPTTPTPSATSTPVPTSTGSSALCGNGVVDDGEDCDGSDLDGEDCDSQVGPGTDTCSGTLGCSSDCHFVFTGCSCACQSDLDCGGTEGSLIVDCSAVPGDEDCELFGVCQNGFCVTSTQGTAAICNGPDPDTGDPRCSE